MNDHSIDINCDVAEGIGNEGHLIPLVSSANIACGLHAGNETLMRETVVLCLKHSVAIGAHPSFPDRANFGRTAMSLPPDDVTNLVAEQIIRLKKIATALGGVVHHVKPHGALYNMAARDTVLAHAIAVAVQQVDPALVVYGLSQSIMIEEAARLNLATAHEVFADRTYQPDGSLTPRTQPNALIDDEQQAVAQALRLAKENKVRTTAGRDISLRADTICLHGDGPRAVEFARLIRHEMIKAAIHIKPV
jgi:UPF0271 protein